MKIKVAKRSPITVDSIVFFTILLFTSSLSLCILNVLMTFHRQWILICRDFSSLKTLPSMHIYIVLMQLIMILLAVLIYGRSYTSVAWHQFIGKSVTYAFIMHAPFAMHLAWLVSQRRHWWHSFVQVASLVVSFLQLQRVYLAARNKDIIAHQHEVKGLIAVVNSAAGSRLLGNVYQYMLGMNVEMSYTFGLSTMFVTFLLPRVYAIVSNPIWDQAAIVEIKKMNKKKCSGILYILFCTIYLRLLVLLIAFASL